jgi:PAS domain S-box-containing protein
MDTYKKDEAELRASAQYLLTLFEQAGVGSALTDLTGKLLKTNGVYQKMLGYSGEELKGIPLKRVIHPDDVDRQLQPGLQWGDKNELENPYMEKRYIRKDGSIIWARQTILFILDELGEPEYILTIVDDITGSRQAQEALKQREAILESVADAAEQFLKSSDWRQTIPSVLESLGRNTDSSHAYLFENHIEPDGTPVTSMRYEWTLPGIEPENYDPVFQSYLFHQPGLERWYAALSQGKPFYGNLKTLSTEEVKALTPSGPTAMIEVPIFVQGQWWGFIGFNDLRDDREWSAAEIDAYQAAAAIIGAAIARQASDAALRETETTVRTLGNNLPNGGIYQLIIGPDGDYRFSYLSEGIQEITGLPVEQMLQTPELVIGQILPEDLARLAEIEQEVNRTEGKASFDIRIRDASGNIKWCHHSVAARHSDNGSIIWDAIVQDVTDRKLAEEEIRQLNAYLELRVRQRTVDLQTANQELEAFSYSVSHDLRGPLRHLDGYSKLLLLDYEDRLDEDGKSILGHIRQSAQQMNQLIDDLLKLSRTTRAEMHPTEVNLSALADQIIASLRQSDPGRQVKVLIQSGLAAWGDASLLKVVLDNLLRNAWKFTSQTPEAHIQVAGFEEDGKFVFYVRDNGAGFDMQYASRLFIPFQRLHRPDEFEGTGIGLATIKRIILRHGGKVWAKSQVGQGATFYFTLDLAKE